MVGGSPLLLDALSLFRDEELVWMLVLSMCLINVMNGREMEKGRQDEIQSWLFLRMDRTALIVLPEASTRQIVPSSPLVTTPTPLNILLPANPVRSIHRNDAKLDQMILRAAATRW